MNTTLTLLPDPAAVSLARNWVRTHCDGADSQLCDAAVLLTSEVVTNAFIHGRSEARITVDAHPDRLRVEVADDNSRHPARAVEDVDALDGRGLTILDLLATAWGVSDDALGKTVWFEVEHR